MKTPLFTLLSFLLACTVAQANFVLFEDFEDVSDWTQSGTSADLASITGIVGAMGAVGQLSHDTGTVSSTFRSLGALSVSNSAVATVFFRIHVPTFAGDTDASHWLGLTDLDSPSGFGDYRAYVGAFATDGADGVDFFARDGSSSNDVDDMGLGEWYNVWMVIDNTNDTYDVYLGTGTVDATSPVAENYAFRTSTTSTLDTFGLFGSDAGGAVPANRPIYIDHIFVDLDGENLSYVIPEPSTWALLSSGLLLGLFVAYRRKR